MTARAAPELHVQVDGAGGEPLVLLHGFAASSFSWRHWREELARDHELHLVDLKGFGDSPTPRDGRYAPSDHAALVVELIRRRELRGVTLVGHSLGGGIALIAALELLREEPTRVRRLILVASASVPQPLPAFVRLLRLPLVGTLLLGLGPARLVSRAVLRRTYHDRSRITADQIAGYAKPFAGGRDRYGILQTARQILPADLPRLVERYGDLPVPALLIWGRQDRIVPLWVGEALARLLPDARLVTLEDCGHIPAEERPAESLAAVRDFLADAS